MTYVAKVEPGGMTMLNSSWRRSLSLQDVRLRLSPINSKRHQEKMLVSQTDRFMRRFLVRKLNPFLGFLNRIGKSPSGRL